MSSLFGYSDKSVILLVFFLGGILFLGLLAWNAVRHENKASFWLSLFTFLAVLYISPFMLGYAGWYANDVRRYWLFYIPFQQLWLIGPILYFYTQSLLNSSFNPVVRDFIHFIPAIIYNTFIAIVFVNDRMLETGYFFYADGKDMDFDPWYQWTGLLSMLLYLLMSLQLYRRYKKRIYQISSFAESILLQWLPRFLVTFILILGLRVLFFILNPEWGQFGSKFWYYACFSILFHYIAIRGYIHSVQHATSLQFFHYNENSINTLLTDVFTDEDRANLKPKNTIDSQSLKDVKLWRHKLETMMTQDHMYTNSQLTLGDVAKAIDRHPKFVSTLVNQEFTMNFNDWVNQYRTLAVIEEFKLGAHKQKTILGIALEFGFNSKSTFNRSFKKYTGTTPVKFLEEMSYKSVSNQDLTRG